MIIMSNERTKEFLSKLADLLDEYGMEIEAEELFYPYEENHGHQISIAGRESGTRYFGATDAREMIEKF